MEKRFLVIRKDGSSECVMVDSGKELDELYRLCECSTIDIVERRIGDRYYSITVDDEGLFVDKPMFTAAGICRTPKGVTPICLAGNLVISNSNNEGELTSLTDEDVGYIRSTMVPSSAMRRLIPFSDDMEFAEMILPTGL